MQKFIHWTGRLPTDRQLPPTEKSGIEYRVNDGSHGAMVELTNDELVQIKEFYIYVVLKVLYARERAANHYRWVHEPAMKLSSLRSRCNGYRDEGRKEAFKYAYTMGIRYNLIREVHYKEQHNRGVTPCRVVMTPKGQAWLKQYNDWFRGETGREFFYEPTHEQFVDREGCDKDESTPRAKVFARKKLEIQP